jgi:hypothetical protein
MDIGSADNEELQGLLLGNANFMQRIADTNGMLLSILSNIFQTDDC